MESQSVSCSRCSIEHNTTHHRLPPGWRLLQGAPHCSDCLRMVAFSSHSDVKQTQRPTPVRTIGEDCETAALLRSGVYIDLADPDYARVHIRDIAAGLTRACRFNGQIYNWWSVSAHCVVGADIAPREIAYDVLMHDATEAFLGDVISPLKRLLPDYRKLEELHESRLFPAFGVTMADKAGVKRVDEIMLAAENMAIRRMDEKRAFRRIPREDRAIARVAASMIANNRVDDWERAFLERFFDLAPLPILIAHKPQQEMAA